MSAKVTMAMKQHLFFHKWPFKSHAIGIRYIHLCLSQKQFLTALHHLIWSWKFIILHTIVYAQTSVTLRGSREKLWLSALQKASIYESVLRTGWLRKKAMEFRTFHVQVTLFIIVWVIIKNCYYRLFDISSLAWVQILMVKIQILEKIFTWLGLFWQSQQKQ